MKNIYLIGLLFFLFSCSAQKEIYQDNPHMISFGKSGGFTNVNDTYKLFSDGNLWKIRNISKDSSLLKQIKKSSTKKIFKQAYAIGLDTLIYDEPGNISKFILFKSKKFNNKVYWEAKNDELDSFYKSLIDLTKN
ncbi:MAG: hypothetical protein C0598_10510 [Marinilabiliales bacterium]|nr:MAG: hypothetical protein C0598_10510 [Marinilabiliales bacterium]